MTPSAKAGALGSGRWWREGIVYQIYPRSFMDANDDGVGDLEGVRQRLDHLSWLGVDAIWLSPFFPSPMADFGYDVADYCDVDPLFGSLADFDRLLAEAHARGLRIILDFVPNHTSDRHPWFRESRSSRSSPKRSWYVWRDPAPGGGPPNNWLATFGGPAWAWDEATGQYYLHSFLEAQPDLDWRNPEVVAAMHDVLRFWLERGVDGFRIDVIQRIAKDPALRDNPVVNPAHGYGGQQHLHDEDHPDVHEMIRGLRRVVDTYPDRMLVGEVYLLDPARVAPYYGRGDDELHLAFNFSFLHTAWNAAAFRREVDRFDGLVPDEGWPDYVLSSHDAPRHASRYDHPELGEARARLAAAMLLTLRGTPFLYQGEEIGMRNVPISEERLRDPLAWALHPKLSRDPSRTPLPWTPGPGAGFTRAPEPWLPLGPDAELRNVARQRRDPDSLLHHYRRWIALRRETPALRLGRYAPREAPEGVFAYERRLEGERAVVALNFADTPRQLCLGRARVARGLTTASRGALPESLAEIRLGPAEGVALIPEDGPGETGSAGRRGPASRRSSAGRRRARGEIAERARSHVERPGAGREIDDVGGRLRPGAAAPRTGLRHMLGAAGVSLPRASGPGGEELFHGPELPARRRAGHQDRRGEAGLPPGLYTLTHLGGGAEERHVREPAIAHIGGQVLALARRERLLESLHLLPVARLLPVAAVVRKLHVHGQGLAMDGGRRLPVFADAGGDHGAAEEGGVLPLRRGQSRQRGGQVGARRVGEDHAVADLARQSHHLATQRGHDQGRKWPHPGHGPQRLDEAPHVAERPPRGEPHALVHGGVAHAHPEAEASARELVDEGGMAGVVGRMPRIEVGDGGPEGDPARGEGQGLAERHGIAEARAVDAGEAAALDLAGQLQGLRAPAGHGRQRHGGRGIVRHGTTVAERR